MFSVSYMEVLFVDFARVRRSDLYAWVTSQRENKSKNNKKHLKQTNAQKQLNCQEGKETVYNTDDGGRASFK